MRVHRDRIGFAYPLEVTRNHFFALIEEHGSEPAISPIHVEPQIILPADRSNVREGIDRARTHGACCPDDEERQITGLDICLNLLAKGSRVHAELCVHWDPANGLGAQAEHVSGLVNPGVRLTGSVETQAARLFTHQTCGPDVPGTFGFAAREKAPEIAQLPPTYQQATAVNGVA